MYLLTELIFNFWTWWYYDFLIDLLLSGKNYLVNLAKTTGLSTHLRFLLTPLYQQKSLWARLISFVFRLIMVFFGLAVELFALVVCLIVLFIYLILPIIPLIKIWMVILNN